MSAHYFGDEVKETKRYKLGRAARADRPAPPADDGDAAQRARRRTSSCSWRCSTPTGSRASPATACTRSTRRDLMRRLVKEKLLRSTARPLFPERRAYTVTYPLSD